MKIFCAKDVYRTEINLDMLALARGPRDKECCEFSVCAGGEWVYLNYASTADRKANAKAAHGDWRLLKRFWEN